MTLILYDLGIRVLVLVYREYITALLFTLISLG